MPSTLPTIKSGVTALYPLRRSNSQDVGISQAYNGSEQRYKRRGSLAGFTLQYDNITASDRASIDAFFTATKGSFDSTWTFPFLPSQQPFPLNGSFRSGLSGWTSAGSASLATGTNGSLFARNGIPSAVAFSNGGSIAAGQFALIDFVSTPIPCQAGETWDLSFWYWPVTNSSAPAGLALSTLVFVRFFDSTNTQIAQIQPGGATTTVGFQPVFASFPIQYPDAASFEIIIEAIFLNTTGASFAVPASSAVIAINSVSAWQIGERVEPEPINGDFSNGLANWTTYQGQSLFVFGVNSGAFAHQGTPSAVAYSSGALFPASFSETGVLGSSSMPCSTGQIWISSFYSIAVLNSLVPSGITASLTMNVSVYDSSGNLLQELAPVTRSSWTDWTKDNATFQVTSAGAAFLVVLFNCTLANTTGSAQSIPRSAAIFAINNVLFLGPGNIVGPPNGNFTNGLNGWFTYEGDLSLTIGLNGGTFARNGLTSAVAYSSGASVPAGRIDTATFGCSPIICSTGQSWTLSFWYLLAKSGSAPAGIVPSFSAFVSIYDNNGTLLQEIQPITSQTTIAGWINTQATFSIAPGAAISFAALIVFNMHNTSGGNLTPPVSSVLGAINSVKIFPAATAIPTYAGNIPWCAFEQDEIAWTQNKRYPLLWSTSLKVRQTISGGAIAPSVTQGSFPNVKSGIVTGYPYTPSYAFSTDRNDLPSGMRVSWAWYSSGLTNFPTRALRGWGLSFDGVSDADLAIIESHFVASGGKYKHFSFTDPDTGVTYPTVRYDIDSLDITHNSVNNSSFKITLAEYF